MSASREKKQRQGAGPSTQEIVAQEKAAAYKSKVRRYTIIGVVVAVLVAILLIWNSGLIQRNQTAATVGGTKYSVNDVNYYYQTAKYNANYIYYVYGIDAPEDDTVIDEETGETYRDYYLETALSSLTQLTALYDAATAAGYKDSDVADTVKEQIATAKSYASTNGYSYGAFLKAQFGRYMTPSAYKSMLTKAAVADLYYSDYYDSLEFGAAELEAYYEENKDSLDTFDYSYLYFTPEEAEAGEDATEEEIAELESIALARAETLAGLALDSVEAGTAIADVAELYPDASFTEHATTVGSSLSSIYKTELVALAAGESVLVENGESGYYVITLHERKLSDETVADVRHILINAETADDASVPTDEAWNAALAQIEEIKAEYLSGDKSEDSFAALAEKYSTDSGSNTNGGLYTGVAQGDFVTEFDSWLFDQAHSVGDIEIIKHAAGEDDSNVYYGYHLAYYAGESKQWESTASSALREADIAEWVENLSSGYEAEYTSASKYVAE